MSPRNTTPNPDSQPDQAGPTGLGSEGVSGNFETSNQPNFSDSNNEDQSGGIFSTPELTVDSENVPDPNAISDDDKSRVAAVFQKTDASARRHAAEAAAARERAIAEEMNEAALAAADIPSTATGDIKLAGEKKKRKKAPLIIIFLILAVMAGGVYFFLTNNTNNEAKVEVSSLDEVKVAFARYANFLLYGSEKDTFEGEFEASKIYTLDGQLASEEYDRQYWNNTTELLGNVSKKLEDVSDGMKNQLAQAFASYRQNYDFIQRYKEIGQPNDADVLSALLGSGAERAKAIVEERYANLAALETTAAETFVAQRLQEYSDVISSYEIYLKNGCLQNGDLQMETCDPTSFSQVDLDRLAELSESFGKARAAADRVVENSVMSLKSYCWSYMRLLTGETEEIEDEGNAE